MPLAIRDPTHRRRAGAAAPFVGTRRVNLARPRCRLGRHNRADHSDSRHHRACPEAGTRPRSEIDAAIDEVAVSLKAGARAQIEQDRQGIQ